jgi:hypothetical protein
LEVHHLLGCHHNRARHVLGEHLEHDLAQAHLVARLEPGPFDLFPVDDDTVGAARIADGESLRSGLDHGVATRAARVVQDEVAGRIAAQDGHGPLQRHLVRRAGGVADLEFHCVLKTLQSRVRADSSRIRAGVEKRLAAFRA